MAKNTTKKKMTEEEKAAWERLYYYVKNLLGYDENQALSSQMVLRLKGLLTGKFIENKNIQDNAGYSYDIILATFKYCKPDIDKALRTNRFQNEQHKFLYITKIVENNINDVYLRMKNAEKAKEEAKNTTVETSKHTGAEFKPKENKNDKFADLW